MSVEPTCHFRTQRRVEFADTDQAGLVHFARFFVFMETAEHELLRSLGTEVHREWQGREIGWPRVSASCRYLSAARFADLLDIDVRVRRKGAKSLTYAIDFSRDGQPIASGELASVCCRVDGKDGLESIPIPSDMAARLVECSCDHPAAD